MLPQEIPLKILVCDGEAKSAKALVQALQKRSIVVHCDQVSDIAGMQQSLRVGDFNVIFIDPLSLGVEKASEMVFSTRTALPEIVFVLYVDLYEVEARRADFFRGQRSRFSHYYKFDKRTPFFELERELDAVLHLCQSDLSWRLSATSVSQLREQMANVKKMASQRPDEAIVAKMEQILAKINVPQVIPVKPKSVFVSYRFEEKGYFSGIKALLAQKGLDVITGERTHSSISAVIVERIKQSQSFLSIMTRDKPMADGKYTTSAWLVEEKGAALALGKPLILMVESGVDAENIGGLQGDWQRIHFDPRGFTTAALQAVEQAAAYAGIGASES